MTRSLHLLSGGAAQGLVQALRAPFEQAHACALQGRYGAVGAMQEALLAGDPCDLVILSQALVDGLVAQGRLEAATRTPLGRVHTGIAVPAGTPHPDVSTPAGLREQSCSHALGRVGLDRSQSQLNGHQRRAQVVGDIAGK